MVEYSIVIPAYNEENRLPNTLDILNSYFKTLGVRYELVVVNDGSHDGTKLVAKECRLIDLDDNMGKGYAIKKGLKQSNGENIIIVDADLPTIPDELIRLCAYLKHNDIVIGSRRMKTSRVERGLLRGIASLIFNKVVRLITGMQYMDTQCGVKVLTREARDKIIGLVTEPRYLFDIDILYAAEATKCTVREEGILWEDREGSKVRLHRDSIDMLIGLVKINRKYKNYNYREAVKYEIADIGRA